MPEEVGRLLGRVAGIIAEKSYGFISADEGAQLFFHKSAFAGEFATLRPGDRVSYIPLMTDKGLRAVAVEVI